MVVSGGTDFYERTFPKHKMNHEDSLDPTMFTNPLMPIYINENGE